MALNSILKGAKRVTDESVKDFKPNPTIGFAEKYLENQYFYHKKRKTKNIGDKRRLQTQKKGPKAQFLLKKEISAKQFIN